MYAGLVTPKQEFCWNHTWYADADWTEVPALSWLGPSCALCGMKHVEVRSDADPSTWPTIPEIAEQYDQRERFVRWMVERGRVAAVRVDRIRVDPQAWLAFEIEARVP